MRSAQSAASVPDWTQVSTGTVKVSALAEPDLEEGDPGEDRGDDQERRW